MPLSRSYILMSERLDTALFLGYYIGQDDLL